MTSKAAMFALLSLWGVGAATLPATAEDAVATETVAEADGDAATELTNRVWVRAGDDQLPGIIKIFLSDGTLVQDSCWETHRLSAWQQPAAGQLSWSEDGVEIKADIVTLTADELVLSLRLKGGDVEERYQPAAVPSVCPDMPKG
jgi:hypothetical protein